MSAPVETLRALLKYDRSTGKLYWRARGIEWFFGVNPSRDCRKWNTRYAGTEAFTTISTTGYFYGNVLNQKEFTHRVGWAIENGRLPDDEIDHEDGDKLNNRIENLREATRSENARNVASSRGATSRFLGVSWDRSRSRWYACITINEGKTKSLGRYEDEAAAARAYDHAASFLYGEFARLNFKAIAA